MAAVKGKLNHIDASPSQTTGTSYKSTDKAMLLRRDDEMLRGPLAYTGHPPYFDLNDQDLMDQSASHYD